MGRPRKRPKTDEEHRAELEAMLATEEERLAMLRALLDALHGESEGGDEG